MATEPTTWATLFDGAPITVKPRERRVSNLLRSYRYANDNFGAALSVMAVQRFVANKAAGMKPKQAALDAFTKGMDDATLAANEDRVREFCAELPPSERDQVLEAWFAMLRQAASNEDNVREG